MKININSKISHKGIPASTMLLRRLSGVSTRELKSSSMFIGHLLGETPLSVEKVINNVSASRIQFLKDLAKKYNIRNAELPLAQKEGKEELFKIFETVEKPLPAHFDVLRKSQGGFDSVRTIFSLAKDEKSLEFVSSLQRKTLRDSLNQSATIIDILKSKHKSTYIDNIEDYASYLKLNSDRLDALKELDSSIENHRYDGKKYDAELAINQLMKLKTVRDYAKSLNSKLIENYTPEHGTFLWRLSNRLMHKRLDAKQVNKTEFLNLYKTTSKENLKLRLAVLDNFKYTSNADDKNELKELQKLFKKVENDEETKKFVTNAVEQGLAVNSIRELNSVIEKISSLKKANYFFENVRRIVALSEGEERQIALKNELENPFFAPMQKRKTRIWKVRDNVQDYGTLGKMQKFIQNKVKVFIFNKFVSKTEQPMSEMQKETSGLRFKKQAAERKIQLQKEVNDIIKTKLGKRTYNEQEDNFRLKATKIRLSLLPDIFESIKAKRAQSRALGLEPTVSNKDASRLYELINGSNRKVVRYMLNKTDVNGNRIFDVKQIIELIEGVNSKIAVAKKQRTDYRASDAKAYYEMLFKDYVEKYGKLRRTNKARV